MLLTLSVISAQSASLGSTAYRVFDTQGGTIGRVDANDWVLPDPAKFVSSHHARIRCHNNVFYLQDLSTNGTFLNSTETPVSKSDLTALGDGDRILIGDYEILVQLIDDGASPAPAPEPIAPAQPAPVPWAAAAPAAPLLAEADTPEASDPLLLLGGSAPAAVVSPRVPVFTPEPVARAPVLPPTPPPPPPIAAPLPSPAATPVAPSPGGSIPDDWQLTGFNLSARPAPERREANDAFAPPAPAVPPAATPWPLPAATQAAHASTLPSATRAPVAPPVAAPIAPPVRSMPGATDDRIAALFKGLGVDPDRVSPETFAELGEILRIVVQGMIEVLQSRTEVKNNFRVPMTTMRPVENNPLKFSLNVDDAIHNLFVKRNPGYLQPVDAFREGFKDVAYHQMAMLAGIRAAFNQMLARFEPDGLQETYERKLKRTLLLGMASKLKYWDLYCEQFEEYDRDAEATFQNLFGEAFAKAYFEQLQQLANTARVRRR
jgi:type VI secretion system FHA domain protein